MTTILSTDDKMNNFWELYGIKENPFGTAPLLVKGGSLPIESFVGRGEQLNRLKKLFTSGGGSRILVYCDVGVGKTTVVNVGRNYALNKGYFTSFKEIAVQEHWNADLFIFNTLASIHSTLKLLQTKPINEVTLKKLDALIALGIEEINAGITLGGIGGNYGTQLRNPIKVSTIQLTDLFVEVINEIIKNTNRDVIIHYNNLELLPEKSIRRIFDNLRDFFQTPKVHFVFVGNLSVYAILQTIPRFSSILSDTIVIDNLSLEEIQEIIKKRFEFMRISKDLNYINPIEKVTLKLLYDLYDGNIRNILNSLSTAIIEVTNEQPVVLDQNILCRTLKSIVEKRYINELQPNAKKILLEAVKYHEVTNRQLSKQTNIARSNVSTYVKQLQEKSCLYLRRKDGKDKFWSVEPKIKWWTLKETDSKQKKLKNFH